MYTRRGFDDKYEQWKEAFNDFTRTNEQIRYARERLDSERTSSGGAFYLDDDTRRMLDRLEQENWEKLRSFKTPYFDGMDSFL